MKQLIHSFENGELRVVDIPTPIPDTQLVLVKSAFSAVSSGTESSLIKFGESGWITRAKSHPEHVQKVLQKANEIGVKKTVQAVRRKLEQSIPLGYSSMGRVVHPGKSGFVENQRVATLSSHAEYALVGKNFCVAIPDNVSDQEAAFTSLASVALHAIRELMPQLGERVLVIGLGILGQISLQILRANGCEVYGLETRVKRRKIASELGFPVFEDSATLQESSFDRILIATASISADPLKIAEVLAKARARIVLLGTADIRLTRRVFFEKELKFSVSKSLGAGRYDDKFSVGENEYPEEFIRWNTQTNMSTVLSLMASRSLCIEPLIEKEIRMKDAPDIYRNLSREDAPLGILIRYEDASKATKTRISLSKNVKSSTFPYVSIIGAGNFVRSTLLPALHHLPIFQGTIVSQNGLNAFQLAEKYNFKNASSDALETIGDEKNEIIIIATQHDTHADLTIAALENGKHVFVEKPVAITRVELDTILLSLKKSEKKYNKKLYIGAGFNRRFSPAIQHAKRYLEKTEGMRSFVYTINAPPLAQDHWLLDSKKGGGVFIGEGVHFIDLLHFMSGAKIVEDVSVSSDNTNSILTLRFANGDIGTIIYTTRGTQGAPKEKLDIFVNGAILRIENATRFSIESEKLSFRKRLTTRAFVDKSKGHHELFKAFFQAIKNQTEAPILIEDIAIAHRIAMHWQEQSL